MIVVVKVRKVTIKVLLLDGKFINTATTFTTIDLHLVTADTNIFKIFNIYVYTS